MKKLVYLASVLTLISCGGSGSSSPEKANLAIQDEEVISFEQAKEELNSNPTFSTHAENGDMIELSAEGTLSITSNFQFEAESGQINCNGNFSMESKKEVMDSSLSKFELKSSTESTIEITSGNSERCNKVEGNASGGREVYKFDSNGKDSLEIMLQVLKSESITEAGEDKDKITNFVVESVSKGTLNGQPVYKFNVSMNIENVESGYYGQNESTTGSMSCSVAINPAFPAHLAYEAGICIISMNNTVVGIDETYNVTTITNSTINLSVANRKMAADQKDLILDNEEIEIEEESESEDINEEA